MSAWLRPLQRPPAAVVADRQAGEAKPAGIGHMKERACALRVAACASHRAERNNRRR
jgi:hypothetical protein